MHRRTYDRLRHAHDVAQGKAMMGLTQFVDRLQQRSARATLGNNFTIGQPCRQPFRSDQLSIRTPTMKRNGVQPVAPIGAPRKSPIRVKMTRLGVNYGKLSPPEGDTKNWWRTLKAALGS